jgi:hypothetical protein
MTDPSHPCLLIALLLLGSCAATTPPVGSAPTEGRGPLRNVVLLPLTTRSLDSLLGHGLQDDGVTPDRSCKVLRATPRLSETSQRLTVIREASADAMVSAGYGPAQAQLDAGELTHLAYVVEITGYAEIGQDAEYRPDSDCCFNGRVQKGCAHGYVERVVRGSGVIKYLKSARDEEALKAAEIFETRTGRRYRVLDEYRFEDAYFGFERGDIRRLCSVQPDSASFEPTTVAPSPNCSVMSYDLQGSGRHLARFLPDLETCRTVGARFCRETEDCVRCIGSFQDGEQRLSFTLVVEPSPGVQEARQIPEAPAPGNVAGAKPQDVPRDPPGIPQKPGGDPETGADPEAQRPVSPPRTPAPSGGSSGP